MERDEPNVYSNESTDGQVVVNNQKSRLPAGLYAMLGIGSVLVALSNLRVLEVRCGLCGDEDVYQHDLVRLYAPKILKIGCDPKALGDSYRRYYQYFLHQ